VFLFAWLGGRKRNPDDYVDPRLFGSSKLRAKKRCPECTETIYADATVCKHCGHRFDPPGRPLPDKLDFKGR
jgi:predicted amidophosphoribosyltransferase